MLLWIGRHRRWGSVLSLLLRIALLAVRSPSVSLKRSILIGTLRYRILGDHRRIWPLALGGTWIVLSIQRSSVVARRVTIKML